MEALIAKYSVYAVFLLMAIEYILGKTKIVKANSTVEAVLNILVSLLKMVFSKDESKIEVKK